MTLHATHSPEPIVNQKIVRKASPKAIMVAMEPLNARGRRVALSEVSLLDDAEVEELP